MSYLDRFSEWELNEEDELFVLKEKEKFDKSIRTKDGFGTIVSHILFLFDKYLSLALSYRDLYRRVRKLEKK